MSSRPRLCGAAEQPLSFRATFSMSIRAQIRALVAVGLISTAITPWQAAHAQQKTDPDDALLFSVQLGSASVGSSVGAFNTRAGVCLDLQDTIDALQIAISFDAKAGTASGWAFQESRRIAIDRTKKRVEYGGQSEELTDDSIWESRSGWCVRAVDLGKWLGVDFNVDVTNAVLGVSSKAGLPIEAAIRRAAMASRLQKSPDTVADLPRFSLPYRLWRAPWIDFNLGFAGDRGPGATFKTSQGYEIFAAGELAYFSANARLVATNGFTPDSLRVQLYRADPDANLLGPVHATQVSLGDVGGFSTPLVAQGAFGRGATITNRPLGRSNEFDTIDFNGSVPVGWDVELYRNGELIDAAKAGSDGRYAFRQVAMRFGPNIFEIASYGPQGQVRRETKIFNIAQQAVPPGQTWWWADAVQQGQDLVTFSAPPPGFAARQGWRQDAGFEHGLGRGFSAGAAIHHLASASGNDLFVDGMLRGGLGPALTQIDVAHAPGHGTAARVGILGQIWGTSVSLEGLQNFGLASQQLSADLKSRIRVSVDRPVRVAGFILPFHFSLAEAKTSGGSTVEASSRVSAAMPGLSASLSLGWQRSSPLVGPSSASGNIGLLFNTRLHGVRLRGEMLWAVTSRVSLADVQVAANWRAGQSAAFEASATYAPSAHAVSLGGGYTRDFKRFALTAGGDVNSQGHVGLRLNLLASFGRGKGWNRLSSKPQAESGGIAATLFRDDDGDGIRGPNEAIVPGGIQVDGVPVARNAADRNAAVPNIVGSLDPSMPVKITVDAATLADPFDIPSTNGLMVVPRAGLMTHVELGIVSTGSIEGKLTDANGAIAGQNLDLVDAKGVVVAKVRTEFDGYFIFERIRYGSYRLRASSGMALHDVDVVLSADHPSPRLALQAGPTALALSKR